MVNYIKELVARIIEDLQFPGVPLQTQAQELAKEIERLDPRDFEPEGQRDFVIARTGIAHLAVIGDIGKQKSKERFEAILPVLDKYRGAGSRGVKRSFIFVPDADLRKIVERDYNELALILFPGAAWKSTVIIAGSILEAILFAVLMDPKRLAQAVSSSRALKGKTIQPDDWRLEHLIDVAGDIGILPPARAKSIDQVLRDYRNFVHPKKEIKSAHACDEAEALMAKGALDGVCNHLEKTL